MKELYRMLVNTNILHKSFVWKEPLELSLSFSSSHLAVKNFPIFTFLNLFRIYLASENKNLRGTLLFPSTIHSGEVFLPPPPNSSTGLSYIGLTRLPFRDIRSQRVSTNKLQIIFGT